MPKGAPNKKYTSEFNEKVVETMRKKGVRYKEGTRQFEAGDDKRAAAWERIHLTEGPEGFLVERRGHGSLGRPPKLAQQVEEDLLAEVPRLRTENAYLKICRPWFWKTSDERTKSANSPNTEAKPEVGNRRHRVQFVWAEALSVADP